MNIFGVPTNVKTFKNHTILLKPEAHSMMAAKPTQYRSLNHFATIIACRDSWSDATKSPLAKGGYGGIEKTLNPKKV